MSVKVTIKTSTLTLGKSEHEMGMTDRWNIAVLVADLVAAYDMASPICSSDLHWTRSLRELLLERLQEKEKDVADV